MISGVRVARREDCAVERADEGRISKCLSFMVRGGKGR